MMHEILKLLLTDADNVKKKIMCRFVGKYKFVGMLFCAKLNF